MEKKPNHRCKVCDVAYYACESCDQHKTYKSMCESENHYKIYNIVIMYTRGVYSKEEAMSALALCDLSDVATYKKPIADIIEEINKVVPKKVKKKEVVIEEPVEEVPVIEEVAANNDIDEEKDMNVI